jgi:hypothetical protein
MEPMPLPIELVLEVITCLLPPRDAILKSSDDITKTLLAFTMVCHETRKLASRYLARYCVHLDSPERLHSFVSDTARKRYMPLVTACSLAPLTDDIEDLHLCVYIADLLSNTCHTLKWLVIDIPLRSYSSNHDVQSLLGGAFEILVNLEEIVSVQDGFEFSVNAIDYTFVWTKWPKLKRMALYNPDCTETFWRHVAEHPSLDTLVLFDADEIDEVDPKVEYLKYTNRPLRVVFCAYHGWDMADGFPTQEDWNEHDPEGKMAILGHSFPDFPAKCSDNSSQQLIRDAIESGTLWDWGSYEITPWPAYEEPSGDFNYVTGEWS